MNKNKFDFRFEENGILNSILRDPFIDSKARDALENQPDLDTALEEESSSSSAHINTGLGKQPSKLLKMLMMSQKLPEFKRLDKKHGQKFRTTMEEFAPRFKSLWNDIVKDNVSLWRDITARKDFESRRLEIPEYIKEHHHQQEHSMVEKILKQLE